MAVQRQRQQASHQFFPEIQAKLRKLSDLKMLKNLLHNLLGNGNNKQTMSYKYWQFRRLYKSMTTEANSCVTQHSRQTFDFSGSVDYKSITTEANSCVTQRSRQTFDFSGSGDCLRILLPVYATHFNCHSPMSSFQWTYCSIISWKQTDATIVQQPLNFQPTTSPPNLQKNGRLYQISHICLKAQMKQDVRWILSGVKKMDMCLEKNEGQSISWKKKAT